MSQFAYNYRRVWKNEEHERHDDHNLRKNFVKSYFLGSGPNLLGRSSTSEARWYPVHRMQPIHQRPQSFVNGSPPPDLLWEGPPVVCVHHQGYDLLGFDGNHD